MVPKTQDDGEGAALAFLEEVAEDESAMEKRLVMSILDLFTFLQFNIATNISVDLKHQSDGDLGVNME